MDIDTTRLPHARELGAEAAVQPEDALDAVRQLSGGCGAMAVLDFVGTDDTLALNAAMTAPQGRVSILGLGGGTLTVGSAGSPHVGRGVTIDAPYWGTIPELHEVVAVAHRGLLRITTQQYPLEMAADAIADLQAGQVFGRAVLVPDELLR